MPAISSGGSTRRSPRRSPLLIAAMAIACCLAVAYAVVAIAPPVHAVTQTLLSQGKPATASSEEQAAFPPSAAVDGNPGTRWSSAFGDPQWLQVDLGATSTISQVVLQWEAAYASAFQIQVSADASTWTSIYATTTGTGGTQTLTVAGTGRYVRMYGTARGTAYGYSLFEFQVFGTQGAGGGTTTNPPPPPSWTPVWNDNFAGPAGSPPSAANWITDTGTGYPGGPANWSTGEVETMTNSTSNVALDGAGHLNITALDTNGAWTSGRVETQRSDFAAPAGGQLMISASIQQPSPANGLGYWPVFRTFGAGYRGNVAAWPSVGETDIMEDVNGRGASSETVHCGTAPGGNCAEFTAMTSGLSTCAGCQSGYHTYSEIIDRTTTDEQIRFSIDGQQVWQVKESQVGVATWQAAIDHGFFIELDLAIGGAYPNTVCGCTSPGPGTSSGGTLSVGSLGVFQTTGTPPPAATTPPVPTGGSVVAVTGGQGNWALTVNGSPYQIKGVTFGPSSDTALAHMPDLVSMGVNTVRTWGTDGTSLPLLNAAAAYGIKVVNGFWLNQGTDYLNDTNYKTTTLNSIVQWVNTYKNNPAVLMWDVGNEVLLTLQNTYSGSQLLAERNAYAQYVDQVAKAIHAADPNHPVTSTDAWTGAWPFYKANSPDLDLYAVNSYGAVCNVRQDWINGGFTKPYIVTESGEPGEWEVPNDANGVPTEPTDQQQAAGYATAWGCVTGHTGVALGATLFNYGNENDFGGVWFNLATGGWKRLSYYQVAKVYGGTAQANTPPVISGLTLSNTTTVPAGGQFTVTVAVTDPNGDPLRYNLMYTSKYVDGTTGLRYASYTQTGQNTFSVTAPNELGVWKVYVYVYDGHGNVGIESRSFKVVPPPVNGTNVALGKPTTASSFQATGTGAPFPPSNATDGNTTTRWASDWSDPQWIQVDLGQVTTFKHVQLVWEAAYGKAYQIQTSNDGTTWTTVHSTTTGAGGVDDFDVTGTGRYVRMLGTARGTTFGYSLYEFGIYT